MNKPITVIKKYGDRRLYDSGASRYVKLEDIARMVRDGIEVKVIDAGTGKDLTRAVLTQIVMEDARERESGLPVQLLQQLVMASDRATHDFLSWYLTHTLDLYGKVKDQLRSGFTGTKLAVSNPIEFIRQMLGGPAEPATPELTDVEQLRRRIAELEARLAEVGRARPAARRKRRSAAKTRA